MKSTQLRIHEQAFDEHLFGRVVKCDSALYRRNRCNSPAPEGARKNRRSERYRFSRERTLRFVK